ncbi:hypothetical protein HDU97_000522 [Phlyctochytrium planicorne]|nr:hypothetical protein HDU97_000522 [Phlyctochytrium planicorne]
MSIESKIDSLRLGGQWKELLDSAPKLRKKLPSGSALDTIFTAESELNILVESHPSFPYDLELLVSHSDERITPQHLEKSSVTAIENSLENAVKCSDEGLRFQGLVLKGRLLLACGEIGKCIEVLESAKIPSSHPRSVGDQGGFEYKHLMPAMYYSTLGNAFRQSNDVNKAFDSFQQAVSALPQSTAATTTVPSQRHFWEEEGLFGLTITSILTAAILRYKITNLLNFVVSPSAKLNVSPGKIASTEFPNPLSGLPTFTKFPLSAPSIEASNLGVLLETYEKIVIDLLPFPRGEDASITDLLRHERVKEVYDWWTLYEFISLTDDLPMAVIDKHVRLIETLYRGTKRTFQSLKLLRYLSHTFLSFLLNARDSISNAERMEALSCVSSYAYSFEKRLNETLELSRKKLSALHSKHTDVDAHDEYIDYAEIPTTDINGESISDAIGVLMTGSKIAILCAFGDVDILNDAVKYADLAIKLVRNHGTWIDPEVRPHVAQRALQNVGVVYGETAQEVLTSGERRQYQALAIQALKDARLQLPDQPDEVDSEGEGLIDLDFQIALQLAEIGETFDALNYAKRSVTVNTSHCASWNLLALLLTSRKDFLNALQICDAGWKEILAGKLRSKTGGQSTDEELQFSWDTIDTETKEELLNLKITQLSIEVVKLGPKAALESLHSLFVLFRKFFGNLSGSELEQSNGSTYRQSLDQNPDGRQTPSINAGAPGSLLTRPHSRGSTGGSSISPLQYSPYSFRSYNLQISLWLIASSLYRILGKFEEAKNAVEQAESLLDSLVKYETRIREAPARIFAKEQQPVSFFTPLQKKSRSNKKVLPPKTSGDYSARWALLEPHLRRVIADILFETFMIKDAKYRASQKTTSEPKLSKYMSDEASKGAAKKATSASGKDGISLPFGRSSRRASTVTVAKSIASALSTLGNGSVANGATESLGVNVNATSSAKATVTPAMMPFSNLINDFLIISNIDDQHLATRVHLANLYKEIGDLALAEYWYERSCKRSKARGSTGGSLGISSIYGGLTSHWGWESWAGFGQLLKETQSSKELALYAALIV